MYFPKLKYAESSVWEKIELSSEDENAKPARIKLSKTSCVEAWVTVAEQIFPAEATD